MNTKSGIVMQTTNSTVYLMTSDGEFIKVKLNKKESLPIIGSEYSGVVIKNNSIRNSIFKYASVACLMLFMLLGGGGAYAYYKPVSTVTISINPAIELKSNMWKKVISANPLNGDGKKILQEISLKNKTVDDALSLVVDQAKKDKFIDENYVRNNKTINISIKGKELALSSFENKVSKDSLNVKIDNNGTVIFNKDLKNEGKTSPANIQPNNNMDKKDVNNNLVNPSDEMLPEKNSDKQEIHNPNNNSSQNKNENNGNKSDDINGKTSNYGHNKDKEKNNDHNSNMDSKYKSDKDNEHGKNNNHKDFNDNQSSSEAKSKKNKKDK